MGWWWWCVWWDLEYGWVVLEIDVFECIFEYVEYEFEKVGWFECEWRWVVDDDERVRERRGGVERDVDGGVVDEVDVENDDKGGEIWCLEFWFVELVYID